MGEGEETREGGSVREGSECVCEREIIRERRERVVEGGSVWNYLVNPALVQYL